MSEPPRRFIYQALEPGQIRLLFSVVQGERIVWTLKTVQLRGKGGSQTPITFDALSYTWGDQNHTFPFICNDQELRIHRNLRDALPYLARRRSSLPIWIDAVCINQSDKAEKFAQVRMMHSIYRQATQTWVWLGCGAKYSKEAIRLLPEVGRAGKEVHMKKRQLGLLICAHNSKILPRASSPIWNSIKVFTQNEWLNRLWIIQEVALAKRIRVQYEDEEIDWHVFEMAVTHAGNLNEEMRNDVPPQNDTAFLAHDLVKESTDGRPWETHLLSIIRLTTDMSQCSDPRDRVFGHLGFISEDQVHQLGLDDSMPTEELYARLTHFLLSNGPPTRQCWWDILQFATATDKMPGLPSWCPDYHSWGRQLFSIRQIEEPVFLKNWVTDYRASTATSFPQPSNSFRELKGQIPSIFRTIRLLSSDLINRIVYM
ncbi:hypothetical protein ONZ43_g3039 [Nemania bipapillata]|uniref:Uncharacterized protein n=1 Tax=Nemania bipapillata TaxID=110536 RepID=A0ACC2IYP0_9PEZI|nr:hypothetical protein ONZ43_g3039 [Nemania bipapillata]